MLMRKYHAFLCLFLCALLFSTVALAEDCFTVNIDSLDLTRLNDNAYVQAYLTAQTQGLRVVKTISDSNELAARVRLTITQMETDTVILDKNYGYVGGTFDSGDVYLPYVDNNIIPYLITLNVEDWTYAIPFMHLPPRLENNGGCTVGIRLSEMGGAIADSWMMGTMLDLDALRAQGCATVPLCASSQYTVGEATVTVSGDTLTVNLNFDSNAQVQLQSVSVVLAGNVSLIATAGSASDVLPAYQPGQGISISGLSTALLYVPFTLSYNTTGLSKFEYGEGSAALASQRALWAQNLQAQAVQ